MVSPQEFPVSVLSCKWVALPMLTGLGETRWGDKGKRARDPCSISAPFKFGFCMWIGKSHFAHPSVGMAPEMW